MVFPFPYNVLERIMNLTGNKTVNGKLDYTVVINGAVGAFLGSVESRLLMNEIVASVMPINEGDNRFVHCNIHRIMMGGIVRW